MKKLFLTSVMIGAFSIAAAADASAWTRSATSTGPRGTSTVQASGSCTYGSCTRHVTRTGPAGNTSTVQASGSCTYGSCTRHVTRTGPAGNTYTRTGTIYR